MNIHQPQPQQVNPFQVLNNKINSLEWKLMALSSAIERHFPQEGEQIERDFFYNKCWSFMMGREVAIIKAPLEQKLSIAAANRSVIDKLREEAKKRGWMTEFNNAEINAKHEAKEMYGS